MRFICFTLFLFNIVTVWASPHPVTASSLLTDPEKGNSFRSFGFILSLEKIDWRPIQKESDGLFAEVIFENRDVKSKSAKAKLSLRMDDLSAPQSIESYAKKWMRDYPQYGFEVLGTKTFAHSTGQGIVIDLLHRQNNKLLRQVVLMKAKKVAVITCSDDKPAFQNILTECNQIVKNFTWL